MNLPLAKDDVKLETQIAALMAKLEFMKNNKVMKEGNMYKKEKVRKAKLVTKKLAWKLVPPKDGEPRTKNFDGRDYHWCTNHASWTVI